MKLLSVLLLAGIAFGQTNAPAVEKGVSIFYADKTAHQMMCSISGSPFRACTQENIKRFGYKTCELQGDEVICLPVISGGPTSTIEYEWQRDLKPAPKPEPLAKPAQTTTRNYEGVGPSCPSKSGVIRWPSEGTFYIEDCATGKTIVEAVFPKPEPLEVPAIRIHPKCEGGCVPPPAYWTCADKSRILEHNEENPPKYWCRKVKTE